VTSFLSSFQTEEPENKMLEILFTAKPATIKMLCLLLQKGFMVRTMMGCSITSLLTEQLGLSPEYVAERISTTFLDGKPVDDMDSAVVTENATLALSAAMPGLVGAVMRKGSAYAVLRDSITYRKTENRCMRQEGIIEIKLFNALIDEVGPACLKRGILISPEVLAAFMTDWPGLVSGEGEKIMLNGHPADAGQVIEALREDLSSLVKMAVSPATSEDADDS
jgi:hypothetical protein